MQVLCDMRRMPVPGTLPSRYLGEAHCRVECPRIDALLRDTTRPQAQRGRECLPELLKFVSFHFLFLLE